LYNSGGPAAAHARQLKAAQVDLEDQPTVNPEDSAEASSFIRHWRIELPSSTVQRVIATLLRSFSWRRSRGCGTSSNAISLHAPKTESMLIRFH